MAKPIPYKNGFRVNFWHNGQKFRKRFSTELEAQQYIDGIITGRIIVLAQGKLISELIRQYLTWSEKIKNKSPKTIRTDSQRLRVFADWSKSVKLKSIKSISVQTIRDFQEYYFANAPFTNKPNGLLKKPKTATTWEKYRQVLSAFLNWCVTRKHMKVNPLSKADEFKVKVQREKPEIFTPAELKQIFEHFDNTGSDYIACFFRFLAYTGCRLSEAINLEWNDVDLEIGEVTFTQTKNYEPRSVPVSDELKPFMERIQNDKSKYVFDSGNGQTLYADSWYWKLLRKATNDCGLKPRKLHAFRHTYCSSLAEADVNLATIKELAGHKRIETTLTYLQFTKRKKREAIARLPY